MIRHVTCNLCLRYQRKQQTALLDVSSVIHCSDNYYYGTRFLPVNL